MELLTLKRKVLALAAKNLRILVRRRAARHFVERVYIRGFHWSLLSEIGEEREEILQESEEIGHQENMAHQNN